MRRAAWTGAAWWLWACLEIVATVSAADEPRGASLAAAGAPAAVAAPESPDAALARGLDLERRRDWTAALRAYQDATQRWPDRVDLRHRQRLCEAHYRLGRRYQDQSFRTVLLRLTPDRALAAYDELLERIESYYVEPVAIEPLLVRGLNNMEVALRDPVFLKAHGVTAAPEQIRRVRAAFQARRAGLDVGSRERAGSWLASACDLGRSELNLPPSAVVLEFVFGACDALDDYSGYLTPDKLNDLYAVIDGNFVGLGVELKEDNDGLRLVGVIRGGPAWEAGLAVGDRITHVGGRPLRGLGLDEAAAQLQGDQGTPIEIAVRHSNGSSQQLRLTRREVEVESVAQAKLVDPARGIGYIQLIGFQKTSTEEIDRAVERLQGEGMKLLVLDLRGNPGGLLNVAVEIAERFVDRGVIVSTRGRAAGQTYVYQAHGRAAWRMPLVVLIDHESASASEILAGALKDHKRATVIGERSYGKGSVQSIYPLRAVPAGLKLTTAKFYSPNNRPYSEQGVEPDLSVRVAAKPVGAPSADDDEPFAHFGDPALDPVLSAAIDLAQKQLAGR